MTKKLGAEFLGTFWLVLGGCGSVVLAAAFPELPAFLHLSDCYEPNITPQKRGYLNKVGKNIGLKQVKIGSLSCG